MKVFLPSILMSIIVQFNAAFELEKFSTVEGKFLNYGSLKNDFYQFP